MLNMRQTQVIVLVRWIFIVCLLLTIFGAFLIPPDTTMEVGYHPRKISEFTRLIYEGQYQDKWIVINVPENQTTINFSMKKVKGWKIIITSKDDIQPTFCKMPHCVFLSPSILRQLTRHFVLGVEPEDVDLYGYIYAIIHGAKTILSVPPDIAYLGNLSLFSFNGKESGIVYNERHIFDPIMFSKNLSQRRLRTATDKIEQYPFEFLLKDEIFPAIQMPIYMCDKFVYVNGKKKVKDRMKIHTKELPSLYVGSDTFARIPSTVILYKYDTFWALLWDKLNTGNSNIPLMLLIQKLIHQLDFHIAFHPFKPCLVEQRAVEQPCKDELLDSNLLKFIKSKQCEELRLSECYTRIAREMVASGYLDKEGLDNLIKWINTLNYVKYMWPPLTKLFKSREAERDIPMFMSTNIYSDYYHVLQQNHSQNIIDATQAEAVCPSLNLNWNDSVIDDVMLVVSFNEVKYYSNILYLELMYRRYFRYILLCGPQPQEFLNLLNANPKITTFFYVEGLSEGWFYMYECTQYALMMNFRVEGYLQIGDDTLVNVWNMFRLPRDQLILPNLVDWYNRSSTQERWFWWNLDMGRTALNRVFKDLQTAVVEEDHPLAKQFLEMYSYNFMDDSYAYYRGGDLFYTPSRLKDIFIYISKVCHRQHLMDEVAIPTIFMGFDKNEKIFRIRDGSLWRPTARGSYWMFFDVNKFFIHPFKLSVFFVNSTGKSFFCDTYLTTSLSKLENIESVKNSEPIKNTGIMWNNLHGGPILPGDEESFLT